MTISQEEIERVANEISQWDDSTLSMDDCRDIAQWHLAKLAQVEKRLNEEWNMQMHQSAEDHSAMESIAYDKLQSENARLKAALDEHKFFASKEGVSNAIALKLENDRMRQALEKIEEISSTMR